MKKIGAKEYKDWKNGKRITRKQAILANCYDCNGEHIAQGKDKVDCKGELTCPLYGYFPYKGI